MCVPAILSMISSTQPMLMNHRPSNSQLKRNASTDPRVNQSTRLQADSLSRGARSPEKSRETSTPSAVELGRSRLSGSEGSSTDSRVGAERSPLRAKTSTHSLVLAPALG